MKNNNKNINTNFIYKIIEKDMFKNNSLNVKTRFPPEPNGHLHIGHAKSIFINFNISKKYSGKCNLRFDDTNPLKEKKKYINSIKKDIKWLGFKYSKNIKYASNYFEIFYKYAMILIKKGLAYIDKLNKKEIKKYRGNLTKKGKNSPFRNRKIKKNINLFKKMKNGYFEDGSMCLRAKINMKSKIIIMRDPVLYRIIKTKKHHQTKKKWCIYPTYDFAHCISDYIEKITHSICTTEFTDNKILYNWILKNIEVKNKPKQYEFARLNIENNILSKRKIQILIKNNIIKNWSDPRLLTISGLRKRGYTPVSIMNFCNYIGITKKENFIQMSYLEHFIKKDLENKVKRAMAVLNPIKVIIYNLPKNYKKIIKIPNHPKIKKFGTQKIILRKKIYIEKKDFEETSKNKKKLFINGKVKLRYSYFIKAKKIKKNKLNKIEKIYCKYYKKITNKKNKKKKKIAIIHWISIKDSIKTKFKIYKNLFKTKYPEKKKNMIQYIDKNSKKVKIGFSQKDILSKILKNYIQFERIGYFMLNNLKKHKNITFTCITKLKK
ncbi:glutamine--tRNA ligase [Buchnera aphidicola (Ceratovacuna keduensis)]|uniref:glutamine--tRNA ligase n=1 Tax=Buchnera aphidicola TaxID=9 RepID=UPI0031B872B3